MEYDKGKLSREQIIQAGAAVVLAKGFAATTMADLSHAANTSSGKLTHHFPTKARLFEAIYENLMTHFESGPLAALADASRPPRDRIDGFLNGLYLLYAMLQDPIGCPVGHAAGDSEGVPAAMKKEAFKLLQRIASLLETTFRDLGQPPAIAQAKADLFVNSWQGAIVVARAGGGLKHLRKVFRDLKEMVDLS
jgi:TetR/AcrR family transcriptional repressor of nem operon